MGYLAFVTEDEIENVEQIKALPDDARVEVSGRLLKGFLRIMERLERFELND